MEPSQARIAGMSESVLFEGMNEEQRAVLAHDFDREGPLLVLAGAGTGKTATLTRRLALELSRGADPGSVMALTFTRKAAGEMRERTAKLLGRDSGLPEIRTFHSLGLQILSEEEGRGWKIAGWKASPRLLDDGEVAAFRSRFWTVRFRQNPSPAVPARTMDLLQAHWGTPGELERAQAGHPHLGTWFAWEDAKRQSGVAEFSDMVAGALSALRQDEALLDRWRSRARTLLVDEYQDTDRTQYRLANLLAGDSPRILAVGDDDQSVYRFRGADIRNVLDWTRDRPDGRILSLVRNYRCRGPILDLSNRLFPDKPEKFRKILVAGRTVAGGPMPVWRRCRNESEEGRWIGAQIALRIAQGMDARDTCVLFRANRQENALRHAMRDLPQSQDGEGEGVRFLTIHAAKGLEWPLVAVTGQDAPATESVKLLDAAEDEERRLFYVACTRARDVLLLTSCRTRPGDEAQEPCRPLPWMKLVRSRVRQIPSWSERLLGTVSLEARERAVRRDAVRWTGA